MTRNEIKGNPREQRQKEKQQMSSSYPPIIEFHSRRLWWFVAALAWGDRYRRYIPLWQWGRLSVCSGWRVGNEEREL